MQLAQGGQHAHTSTTNVGAAETGGTRKSHRFSALPVALFVVLGPATICARGATTPNIFSAVVNYSNHRMTITGQNFSPSGLAPKVSLANIQLTLVSFTNQ